jgi:hypothetical protein
MGRELRADWHIPEPLIETGGGLGVRTKLKGRIARVGSRFEMFNECAATASTSDLWVHVDMSQAAEADAVDVGIRRDAADGYQALIIDLRDKEFARSIKLYTIDFHVTEEAAYESKPLSAGNAGKFAKAREVSDAE